MFSLSHIFHHHYFFPTAVTNLAYSSKYLQLLIMEANFYHYLHSRTNAEFERYLINLFVVNLAKQPL